VYQQTARARPLTNACLLHIYTQLRFHEQLITFINKHTGVSNTACFSRKDRLEIIGAGLNLALNIKAKTAKNRKKQKKPAKYRGFLISMCCTHP